jgi:hypothetical protein
VYTVINVRNILRYNTRTRYTSHTQHRHAHEYTRNPCNNKYIHIYCIILDFSSGGGRWMRRRNGRESSAAAAATTGYDDSGIHIYQYKLLLKWARRTDRRHRPRRRGLFSYLPLSLVRSIFFLTTIYIWCTDRSRDRLHYIYAFTEIIIKSFLL